MFANDQGTSDPSAIATDTDVFNLCELIHPARLGPRLQRIEITSCQCQPALLPFGYW
jgi:hypothetical protein